MCTQISIVDFYLADFELSPSCPPRPVFCGSELDEGFPDATEPGTGSVERKWEGGGASEGSCTPP